MIKLKIIFYSSKIITVNFYAGSHKTSQSQDTFPSYYFEQSTLWRRYIHIKNINHWFCIFRENPS